MTEPERRAQINPGSFECTEFTDENNESFAVSVIIAPIRIIYDKDREGRPNDIIMQGCNLYRNCRNLDCQYSVATRDQSRARKVQQG